VRSIQQDSAQEGDWPGRLCPECGLCCNGVLFADVQLEKGEDPLALQSAGLVLGRVRGRPAFSQPCACFDGRLCRIYPDRPKRCRGFDCYTLQRLERGDLDLAQALRRVQDASCRAEHICRLLRKLGQTDESLALTHRYRQIMERPVDLSDGGMFAGLRGELMLAVGELMDLVHQEFLKPVQPCRNVSKSRSKKALSKPRPE